MKLGFREGLTRDEAIDLVVHALYRAAEEDSATGGPDLIRGIFPVVATITAEGYERVDDAELRTRVEAIVGQEAHVMTMPFYVAPEQVMKDRADYARKGIARGRSAVAVLYTEGILIAAENSSATLHKVSEIYDRIAFAGVGKYNEFDQLRIAGVRHADLKGYQYSREDVDARSLANAYAQILGQIFTHEMKPMEVEILVAEVGEDSRAGPGVPHPLRRLGGRRGPLQRDRRRRRGDRHPARGGLPARPRPGRSAQRRGRARWPGPTAPSPPGELEVAVLSRTNGRRAFRRIEDDELAHAAGV